MDKSTIGLILITLLAIIVNLIPYFIDKKDSFKKDKERS